MRRNQVVAIGVLVLLVALALIWRLSRHGDEVTDTTTAGGSAAHGTTGAGGGRTAKGPRAPAAPAAVSGRVTRKADGTGVEGALVMLARSELDAVFGGGDNETLNATTDAQGMWKLDKLPPGRYTVAATAKGLVGASLDKLVFAEGEHKTGVDIALEAGGTRVSGTVSDVGGGAVVGARVTVSKDQGTPWGAPKLLAMTGPDGKYEIYVAAGDYEASVTHDDYTMAMRSLEVAAVPLTVDFVLSPGGTIHGVVVTRDGKPLPQAQVMASGSRGRAGGGGFERADDKGEFSLHSLGSGAISLTASGRGYASQAPTVVELGIGEQVDGVRVIVDRAFSISGNVVEVGTKKGVPGVRVGAFSIANPSVAIAPDPSDADGAFEIVGVKPGSFMLFAISEDVMPEVGKPVQVVDKDVTGVEIEMGVGVTVTGKVDPPAMAEISIEPTQVGIGNIFEAVKSMLVRGQSSANGEFVLHHVPPGAFTLRATVADGRKGSTPLIVEKVDKSGVIVKIEPRASIAGKVVDANGAPVAYVHVSVKEKGDDGNKMSIQMNARGNDATTGPDGAFRIVGLDAGVQELRVSDDQARIPWADAAHKAKPKEPVEITLATAEQKTGVTLTVEARDGVIKGVVLGADKKPVADAWVTARLDGGARAASADAGSGSGDGSVEIEYGDMMGDISGKPPTITGADGTFTLEHLRKHDYVLVAEAAKGTARIEQRGVKTGSTVTLVLAPLGTLTGKVTVGGKPATTFEISCDGDGPDVERQVTSADGTYTLERLAPGHVKCTATGDAGHGSGEVDVPAGPATLDIALAPWASITGTVVSVLTGEPIAGLKLIATGPGFSGRSITDTLTGKGPTSDAQGHFVIPEVSPGKGEIEILPADALVELAKREYEVTAGQRLDLGTIKVVPPRTGDAGTLGFSTVLDGETMTVSVVKPGGPAEAGGVLAGDKVVAINGVPVATLTAKLAQTLVSSGNVTIGQRYQLTLDRGGTRVEVVLVGVRW